MVSTCKNMPHWTTSEHGNRVLKTRFLGQNQVSKTRVASKWYYFVTGTTNYIVWILLLVTHFNQKLFCYSVFSFSNNKFNLNGPLRSGWYRCLNNNFRCLKNITHISTTLFHFHIFLQHLNNVTRTIFSKWKLWIT